MFNLFDFPYCFMQQRITATANLRKAKASYSTLECVIYLFKCELCTKTLNMAFKAMCVTVILLCF